MAIERTPATPVEGLIEQEPEEFKQLVGEVSEVKILKPGETISV